MTSSEDDNWKNWTNVSNVNFKTQKAHSTTKLSGKKEFRLPTEELNVTVHTGYIYIYIHIYNKCMPLVHAGVGQGSDEQSRRQQRRRYRRQRRRSRLVHFQRAAPGGYRQGYSLGSLGGWLGCSSKGLLGLHTLVSSPEYWNRSWARK